jgi:hypothetical protein
MPEGFSESTRHWIGMQDVVAAAKERFRREWARILREAEGVLRREGWASRLQSNPSEMLQVFRPNWPGGLCGIHYEAQCNDYFCEQGFVDLSLHIEHEVLDQSAVCDRIRRLLSPYRQALLSSCSASLPDEPLHDILKGKLPLSDVTSERIVEVINSMAATETFVDEAMFLADKTPIWRTDFFPGDPQPQLDIYIVDGRHGKGGQELRPSGGCLDTRSVVINGTAPTNYHAADGSPTNIMLLTHTKDVDVRKDFYLSCIVRTTSGGRLWLYGEGYDKQPDGKQEWPALLDPAWTPVPVEGKSGWQHIGWQGHTDKAAKYDFAGQGATFYLRAQIDDSSFALNSIEFGHCG